MAKKGEIKLTVNVTRHHIHDGETGDSTSCPIGLAIRDMLNDDNVSVDVESREAFVGPFIGSLPPRARKFIEDFDAEKPVKPFRFTLRGSL